MALGPKLDFAIGPYNKRLPMPIEELDAITNIYVTVLKIKVLYFAQNRDCPRSK